VRKWLFRLLFPRKNAIGFNMKLNSLYLSVFLSAGLALPSSVFASDFWDFSADEEIAPSPPTQTVGLEIKDNSVVYDTDKLLPINAQTVDSEFRKSIFTSNFFDISAPVKPTEKPTEELLASSAEKPTTSTDTSTSTFIDQNLKTALEYVYANHPALKAKREELKATDEGVAQAVSGFRPNVSAGLSKGRQRVGDAADTWNYGDTKARTLDVEQPIFNGGGTIASFKAAKENVKAKRAELSALEQQTLYDAVVAYTDVVEKQAVLALNQKNVDVLTQQLSATKARFDVGMLTITDVAQATSRLATAQSSERQSIGDLEVAKATFKRVIGYDAPAKIDMPPVPVAIPSDMVQANEIAKSNSPILEAAKRSEKAAENNIYVNGAAILPSVTLQGTMSRSDGVSSGFTGALSHISSDAVKLNVSIPIYQSGAEWSRLRAARNVAQQAKFNTMDTHEAVVESVATAWESFKTAQAIIISNESAVNAAETALDGVRKENEFGVRTVLDVLDAEQESFTAKVELIKAQRAEKIMAYRLIATVGKLTSVELGLNTEVENPKEHYDSVKYQLLGL